MSYSKWVTRAPGIGAVLCVDEAEEKQLLDDWAARDAKKVEKSEPLPETVEPTLAEMRELATSLGIEYGQTWGVKQLQKAIAAKAAETKSE